MRLLVLVFLITLFGCIGSPVPRNPMVACTAEIDSEISPVDSTTDNHPDDIPLEVEKPFY